MPPPPLLPPFSLPSPPRLPPPFSSTQCREIYKVKACGDVIAYQCVRDLGVLLPGQQFSCKCEAYVPPWAKDIWSHLSPEERTKRKAEAAARAARKKALRDAAAKGRAAEELTKKNARDKDAADRAAADEKARAAQLAKQNEELAKRDKRNEENAKWGGLLNRNDKCCGSNVNIHDGLNRVTNAIKKLDPKNADLLRSIQEQADLVRGALAADAKLAPVLTESEVSKKMTAMFKQRAGQAGGKAGVGGGGSGGGMTGMLTDPDRKELEFVLRNKYASDRELRNKLTCCAEQLVEDK